MVLVVLVVVAAAAAGRVVVTGERLRWRRSPISPNTCMTSTGQQHKGTRKMLTSIVTMPSKGAEDGVVVRGREGLRVAAW